MKGDKVQEAPPWLKDVQEQTGAGEGGDSSDVALRVATSSQVWLFYDTADWVTPVLITL